MFSKEDILNQKQLLQVYRRNLAQLLIQQAQLGGSAHAPLSIINGIQDARNQIQRIKTILLDWGVDVETFPDDMPPDISVSTSSPITQPPSYVPNTILQKPANWQFLVRSEDMTFDKARSLGIEPLKFPLNSTNIFGVTIDITADFTDVTDIVKPILKGEDRLEPDIDRVGFFNSYFHIGSGYRDWLDTAVIVRVKFMGARQTQIFICGMAAEGFIKQRAGEKAANRIAKRIQNAFP